MLPAKLRALQIIAIGTFLGLAALPAGSAESADGPPLDFVVGDYVLIGRDPDGGAAYSGTARIEESGDGLALERSRGDHHVKATGRLEVPSPPGEGHVLRFRWQDPAPTTMTCLVAADLDNYARLTCYWLKDGPEPRQPGLEAMFPTAAWPDQGGSQ
jgi:hypothetical protein